MKLSICEIETYQFVKSTPSKFQSARLKTVQFVKSINWYFQVLIIRQNETFSLCNLNFSICQVNQSTYSSGINLTQWNFEIVELKLFNVSNWQIEVFQFYRFNQIKDSKYHIETLEFVASTNWHIQESTIRPKESLYWWNLELPHFFLVPKDSEIARACTSEQHAHEGLTRLATTRTQSSYIPAQTDVLPIHRAWVD